MLGFTLAALAMLDQGSGINWKDDGTVEISITFVAADLADPFPQGETLMVEKATEACGTKGAPAPVSDAVINGIEMTGSSFVTMSRVYACRKG